METGKENPKQEIVQAKTLPLSGKEQHLTIQTSYSGPIPPPELFAGYEKVLPGLADRVMIMSESQTTHRIEMESKVVKGDSFRATLGLVFAFFIVIFGMLLGAYLIYKDKPISGFVAMITPLGVVIGAFVVQNKKPSEKENKPEK